MEVWQDADGNQIPTSTISSRTGAEHCGSESVTYLTVDGSLYISDPMGALVGRGFVGEFEGDVELPSDASDTGYESEGRQLWLSRSEPSWAFIVTDDAVEAWPFSAEGFACY